VTPFLLHLGHYWSILTPPESHRFFGAGFLFIGVLLVVEVVAGNVWFQNRLRTLIWPVMAMTCGEGLIVVSMLDPVDRAIHFTVGLLVLGAGWLELRFRLGKSSRTSTDLVVVPALLAGGFEMGVVHARGTAFTTVGHMAMGMTAAMMAGARLYQGRRPSSFSRNLATGFLVIALALILLVLQP
jgi:hypothetical protein